MNSGLEDARNLGWKLAAVLQGWGGSGLLASYGAERRPVFASTMHDFIAKSIEDDRAFLEEFDPARNPSAFEAAWQSRAQGAVGEVHAFEPHYEGSPLVWQEGTGEHASSAKGSHRFEARAGHHLAPAMLASGRNVYELLGQQFTLLAIDATESVVQVFEQAAAAQGIALTVVHTASGAEADRYQARWVLIRPDQFVAWHSQAPGVSAQAASHVLRQAAGFTSADQQSPSP